jgi:hypothetical protein
LKTYYRKFVVKDEMKVEAGGGLSTEAYNSGYQLNVMENP